MHIPRFAFSLICLSLSWFGLTVRAGEGAGAPSGQAASAGARDWLLGDLPESSCGVLSFLPREPLHGPLVTDRPDFTESTKAVAPGSEQLELGYLFTYDNEDDVRVRSHTGPEMLLRVGLVENLELRITWNSYTYVETRTTRENGAGRTIITDDWTQGTGDLALEAKVKFLEQDGMVPHFGMIAELLLQQRLSEHLPYYCAAA